jgi:hypothetical protein
MKKVYLATLLLCSIWRFTARGEDTTTSVSKPIPSKDGINYQVKQEREDDLTFSSIFPRFQDVFNSPLILSGVQAGSKAINQSVDSLMDTVFYRLLDNTFIYSYNETYQLNSQLTREVFTTDLGSYVVVDRLLFGPEYSKQLISIENVPIMLGAYGKIDILDIYTRSDAVRVAEQKDLPFWRMAVNNWFGILPLLRAILPPAFNPVHLYDPIRQVKTPFVFPFSHDSFKAMPVGTIRSYAITGGVNLPFQVSRHLFKNIEAFITQSLLDVSMPYTLFVSGEHRINVLRKSNDIAWVGLSTNKTGGHSLAGMIGTTFFLLSNSIPPIPFKGLKTPFFPIDIGIADELINSDQQLYEFNLADERGLAAYLAAVRGDFSQAKEMRYSQKKYPYFSFHFEKKSVGQQVQTRRVNNLFVYRAEHHETSKRTKNVIYDPTGKYHFWEASRLQRGSDYDVILGETEINYNNLVEMQVAPETEQEDDENIPDYSFKFVGKTPYQLVFSFQIKDLLADVYKYRSYLHTLEAVSKFSLKEFPDIPNTNAERKEKILDESFFSRPDSTPYLVDDSVSRVGKFHATFTAYLPFHLLRRAIEASDEEKWQYFAESYNLPASERNIETYHSLFSQSQHFFRRAALYPLRIFNVQSPRQDAFNEAHYVVNALNALRGLDDPVSVQKGFYQLLRIEYPDSFIKGMMKFAPIEQIPRVLTFFIKPQDELGPGIKSEFERINAKKFSSAFQNTDFDRSHIAQEELEAFFPTNQRGLKNRPVLSDVFVRVVKNPERPDDKIPDFFVEVRAKGLDYTLPGKVYARLETKGEIQIGKYVLIEEVFDSPAQKSIMPENMAPTMTSYHVVLSRPSNLVENLLFQQQYYLSNEFQLTVAVSQDGSVWSDEKHFNFSYDGVNLKEIKEKS